jgi:hypothetical protein
MKKYKNVSGKDLFVRGIGLVKKDAIISGNFNSKKFEEVKKETKKEVKK